MAFYLINQLPTLVLNHKSLFQVLHGMNLDYSMLCPFGYLCYTFLRYYQVNKFCPKSLPCVLLGISNSHKGFCCLEPSIGQVYISRHVVFNESTFPCRGDIHSPSLSILHGDCSHYTDMPLWVSPDMDVLLPA